MSDFQKRYDNLNQAQRQAVDKIDGPLLVIAGPGTGKTELLSLRTANIIAKTDCSAENILCLTFTDSGASAMRQRLVEVIGQDAYRVAIHTFHSFGSEIINQNYQYFYQGASFKPADEISRYQLMVQIFDELDHQNPLVSKMNGSYVYLNSVLSSISNLKKAALTSDELLNIVSANELVIDAVEADLKKLFANGVKVSLLSGFGEIAQKVANLPEPVLPKGITPLQNSLSLSMAHTFDEVSSTNKTNSLTAWRNRWLEKDELNQFVFRDRKRNQKLRALSHIYYMYLTRMERAGLYDYDDMIMNAISGVEANSDLKYNLQEKYQYIMVDEFQDTNLAQLRLLFDLTDYTSERSANIMAVGDDDQAIYSFQGADVNNIHRYIKQFPDFDSVILTNNYRSDNIILEQARDIISQGADRLESTMGIDKSLTAMYVADKPIVQLYELTDPAIERQWVADEISRVQKTSSSPVSIAVIAKEHNQLIELAPFLQRAGIKASYEKRDNVLDQPIIQTLELLAKVILSINRADHETTNSLLPELLSHPMFDIPPVVLWKLSLDCYNNRKFWLEVMLDNADLTDYANWLIAEASKLPRQNLEEAIDALIGNPNSSTDAQSEMTSPVYRYFFSREKQTDNATEYLGAIQALRAIRTKLRDFKPDEDLNLGDFVEFIELNRELKIHINSIRYQSEGQSSVQLMTAHKSKGLEFDVVFIINCTDKKWGEKASTGGSQKISYPENLPITPAGNGYEDRLKLFFVASTRARSQLIMSYPKTDMTGRDQLVASFLANQQVEIIDSTSVEPVEKSIERAKIAWSGHVSVDQHESLKDLLLPTLANYKLSITHLNNFIDVTKGGPDNFILNNLLHFPQAKSPNASYGTAIHRVLQKAHNHLTVQGEKRPIEDILGDFVSEIASQRLTEEDEKFFRQKGIDSLTTFLDNNYQNFRPGQKTELNFSSQGVVVDSAVLTGSLDLVDTADHEITVTDYKTGKPSANWKGTSEYEKIKLHKYRQQLMFYQLLCQNSRDFKKYKFKSGILQFVEPDQSNQIHQLEACFSDDELARFTDLIVAVWQSITTFDFPAIDIYPTNYKGILAFEEDLIKTRQNTPLASAV